MLLRTVWIEGRPSEDFLADEAAAGAELQVALRLARDVLSRAFGLDTFRQVTDGRSVTLLVRALGVWHQAFTVSWTVFQEKALLECQWWFTSDVSGLVFNGAWVESV